MFTPPKLNLKPTTRAEIPFHGSVAAGGYLTLVSGYIIFPFRVVKAKMEFLHDARQLVEYRWYVSRDTNTPTTGWPTDTNLYGRLSPNAGFRGQGVMREVPQNIEVHEEGTYLKMSVYNGLGLAYYANGSITIEEI
jgi:hypothetical protein